MPTFLLVAGLSATLGATPQGATPDLPISVNRIREELAKTPPTRLELVPVQVPVATFKMRVDERRSVITMEEWLEKEFELTELQRQSADWAAKCCGISLDPLFKSLEKALERRKVRKIREQIARELAELEAVRKKAGLPDLR